MEKTYRSYIPTTATSWASQWGSPRPQKILWGFAETCRALGISRSTGERLSRGPSGAFPRALRIRVRRFHRPEDVQAWLAAKAEKSA